jgi:hypothetical protein
VLKQLLQQQRSKDFRRFWLARRYGGGPVSLEMAPDSPDIHRNRHVRREWEKLEHGKLV